MNVICHADRTKLPKANASTIPVHLYGAHPHLVGEMCVGGPVLREVKRLGLRVPQNAFDFLTFSMAVTAADTFVRRVDADDGWCRDIRLLVAVGNPAPWQKLIPLLQRALGFLSGDIWHLSIVSDGIGSPMPQTKGDTIRLPGHDCVCLFSGGLDSTIGTLD